VKRAWDGAEISLIKESQVKKTTEKVVETPTVLEEHQELRYKKPTEHCALEGRGGHHSHGWVLE
jgi:hypothetical protein